MATRDDSQQNNNRQNQESNQHLLAKAGIAVAAAGASTALFYRSGGGKYLAKTMDKSYKFLSETKNIVARKRLEDITISDVRSMAKDSRAVLERVHRDFQDKPLEIRTTSNTLFGYTRELESARAAHRTTSAYAYQQNNLVVPAEDHFINNFADTNKNRTNNFKSFIKEISRDVDSRRHEAITKKRFGFAGNDANQADELITLMRERKKNASEEAFDNTLTKALESAVEQSYDINALEKKFGTSTPKFLKGLWESVADDHAATVEDVLKNKHLFQKKSRRMPNGIKQESFDYIEDLERMRKKFAEQGADVERRFLNVTPDVGGLRKNAKGELYSFTSASKLKDSAMDIAAGSLPGQIFKLRDIQYSSKAPAFQFLARGSFDPVLAAITNASGQKEGTLDSNYFRISDKLFRVDGEKALKVDTPDMILRPGKYGASPRLLRQITRNGATEVSSNPYMNYFDVMQSREEPGGIVSGIKSIATKFNDPNWRGNVFRRMTTPTEEERSHIVDALTSQSDINDAFYYLDDAKRVEKFFSQNTYDLSQQSIDRLLPHASKQSKHYFELLKKNDAEDILEGLLAPKSSSIGVAGDFLNADLAELVKTYQTNPSKALGMIQLKTDRARMAVGSNISGLMNPSYNNESATFKDILKAEIGKEAFLQHAVDNSVGDERNYGSVLDLLKTADIQGRDAVEAKRLAHFAMFQDKTGINIRTHGDQKDGEIWNEAIRIDSLFRKSKAASDVDFQKTFQSMVNEEVTNTEMSTATEVENIAEEQLNDWIHLRKTTGPLDIIKSMNDWEKFKATTKTAGKQFLAGADDPGNISSATMGPYFMLARLSDEMNKVGLGFSAQSMGSTGELLKNITTKRILPVAIGATYLEWMDDTSEAITGTSMSGALASGVGNVDLSVRKLIDSVGLTQTLKDQKAINPIWQYWGGKDEYQDYDERKKYYEEGYTPVRKAAWWTFGGVNEARGGEIQYWEPTFVRRINSDWKDKSLYDGYFDKWSHSLLPTPSNPFSPVRALMDPYWLEEKHADDRPYAMSGPMFAEGTPWGAILNPTVGALIKPEKEMHSWRMSNGVDMKALLHSINETIHAKARDLGEQNLIAIKGDSMSPVRFTGYDAPTSDSAVMSVQYNQKNGFTQREGVYGVYNGGLSTTNLSEGFSPISSPDDIMGDNENSTISFKDILRDKIWGNSDEQPLQNNEVVTNSKGVVGVYHQGEAAPRVSTKFGIYNSMTLDMLINGDSTGIKRDMRDLISKVNPMNLIREQNDATKNKATDNPDSFDTEEGILTPEKLSHFRPSQGMALLDDPDTVAELINAGKGSDFVRDASTSFRLVSGIYGYMASEAAGIGSYTDKRIAQASDMTSFSRTFWDSGIGGAGGPAMEIIRRFIPDFKRGQRVNPLMNEMPDWMPERYRFGDPFTALPKGEMRMPGKGYESLNALHPDQYGQYGAFDRFKILADIAPFSSEYKMWREIAKKTVADPKLREEMDVIRGRVSQQGKKHEFYDYNVVGKGLEYENVVVSEILGYGKFKSGDDKIYKIAGARVKSNDNETMQDVLGRYIHVGQEVTVAVDDDPYHQKNNDADKSINAAVFTDGQNVSQSMIDNGDAIVRKGDTSAAAILAKYSPWQRALGFASEVVAHADIPWLSDQYLRVRTPLESYKAEQVYGTPYQTWSHPIDTFLAPAVERAIHDRSWITTLSAYAYNHISEKEGLSKWNKHLLNATFLFSNRGAFIGGALVNLYDPGNAKLTKKAMTIGSNLAAAAHVLTGGSSYFDQAVNAATIGQNVARFFEKDRRVGAVVGAAVGMAYRAIAAPKDGWIPDRTKKKWEMEEYFDRLTYLKYMGLYKKAAEKAKDEEDVDVEDIMEQKEQKDEIHDRTQKYLKDVKEELRQVKDSPEKKRLMKMLNGRLNSLAEDTTIMKGGEWTHSALIYKQAADSTMTGLKQGASWAQIITALPQNDREYFMEFVKERDPEKRDDILKVASPAIKKALSMAWGMKTQKEKTNEEYFKDHALPQEAWVGWRPDVDLKNIEVKTIDNEAMNLSDFGFYESQLRDPNVASAEPLNIRQKSKNVDIKTSLKHILVGKGLKDVDVNVINGKYGDEHQITANIKMVTGLDKIQRMVSGTMAGN